MKVKNIQFVHQRGPALEVQSADQAGEGEVLGYVVMSKRMDGSQVWHCQTPERLSLLIQSGKVHAFSGPWEAGQWLLMRHNGEMEPKPRFSLGGVLT
jgi:hypothetical protein